jgi:hypothetical protein
MGITISSLFEKDLNKLADEIALYKNEDDLWKVKEGISNSGGNLALHITGSLNHFIGAILDNNGYIRDRDKEFSLKNVPRSKIIDDIKNTIVLVTDKLNSLSQEDLEKDFPVPFNNVVSSTGALILFFLAHLNYHLGQINYHRRLID